MKDKALGAFGVIAVMIIVCSVIYGVAYLGKLISYKFWYEDQVQQTIIEMVDDRYFLNKETK